MKESGKQLAIWGIILQFGFLIGLAGAVIGICRSYAKLGELADAVTLKALAPDINLAIYATAGGMISFLIGAILLLVALFVAKYRASWFRTTMWILAVLWVSIVPIGTVLGIIVMIHLSRHSEAGTAT